MAIWKCTVCNYIYDESHGDPEHGIAEGTPWEDIADSWFCPDCCATRDDFFKVSD